jgi:hypothetical protein
MLAVELFVRDLRGCFMWVRGCKKRLLLDIVSDSSRLRLVGVYFAEIFALFRSTDQNSGINFN